MRAKEVDAKVERDPGVEGVDDFCVDLLIDDLEDGKEMGSMVAIEARKKISVDFVPNFEW